MKKLSYIFCIISVLCFLVSFAISMIQFKNTTNSDHSADDIDSSAEELNTNDIYECIKENKNDVVNVKYSYKITINKDNEIEDVLHLKQYIYTDKMQYFYRLYKLRTSNTNFVENFEQLTINLYLHDGPLVDEENNIVKPNKEEYITNIIHDGYTCSSNKS